MSGKRQRDGSSPGANVEKTQRPVGRQSLKDGFDQVLGLRSWDERGRGDFEGEAEKLLLPGDVLNRLVAQPPNDSGLIEVKLLISERTCGIREQGSAIQLQNMQQQKLRIAMRVVAKVRAGCELVGGESQGLTEGHRAGCSQLLSRVRPRKEHLCLYNNKRHLDRSEAEWRDPCISPLFLLLLFRPERLRGTRRIR
jgi:hypothetical protein